jgi:hypothetical protein
MKLSKLPKFKAPKAPKAPKAKTIMKGLEAATNGVTIYQFIEDKFKKEPKPKEESQEQKALNF